MTDPNFIPKSVTSIPTNTCQDETDIAGKVALVDYHRKVVKSNDS